MAPNELISFIANIALTISVIVAVVFGIAQVKNAEKDRRERLTMETLRSFHSREFAELLYNITRNRAPQNYEEWKALSAEDQTSFIQLSQQMESIGILLAERYISLDLVDKTLGSFVFTTWERYRALITEMRERFNDPYLSEYFQWMAEQIEQRVTNKPREPFFKSGRTAV